MKYNTLRIIRQMLKKELAEAEREKARWNEDLKKRDPDGLLPKDDVVVKMRKAASDWASEVECALKDFDAQDWQ